MSVKYNDKLVATTWNYIKDNTVGLNSSYSSQKTQDSIVVPQDENDRLIALLKGVRDVTHSYEELENYDTDKLVVGDVINVLKDETHEDGSTYYRWDGQAPFTYIGEIPPYYTKPETDVKLDAKQDILVDGVNIKTINGQSLLGQGDFEINPGKLRWFPVGTIYPAYNDIDPNDFIGGTWELLTDRFLAQGTKTGTIGYGYTGGSETVTLTFSTMGKHTHEGREHSHNITTDAVTNNTTSSFAAGSASTNFALPLIRSLSSDNNETKYSCLVMKETSGGSWNKPGGSRWMRTYSNGTSYKGSAYMNYATPTTQDTGGGQPHNNMHRYLAVNYWIRTA